MAYRLAAAAKGFSPGLAQEGKAVRVVPDANGAFDVVLAPGGAALAGAATDAAGRAIPDAEIRLVHWQPPWMAIGVRANSVGRYEQWVSEGAWTVSGIAEGYACSGVPAVAPSEDASVVLAPGGILKGVVESEADRQRVAGVEVTAKLLAPNRSYVLSTVTTDDGSFVLSSLEGGSYLVRAAGRGLRGEIPFVSVAPRQQPSVSIPVRSAARVRGRVLIGSQSTPCEEGSVTLGAPGPDVLLREGSALPASPDGAKPGQTWGPQTSTQIDSQGNALFESVAPGHYFATVECRDHVLASGPDVIDVSERDVQGLVWRVEPGVGVDVQVVDELARPVAGAEAWLEGPVESGVASKSMPLPTDGTGRYKTPLELRPGLYTLKADWTHQAKPVSLDLRHASGVVSTTLRLDGSAAVALTLRGTDGRALDGLLARAYPATSVSPDSGRPAFVLGTPLGNGRYRIGPLAPGRYAVDITDELNPPVPVRAADSSTLSVAAGAVTEASATLDRSGRIGGRVVDGAGNGAAGVWVTLIPPAQSNTGSPDPLALERSPRGRMLTDEAGQFAFPALAPLGVFTVLAESADAFAIHHGARSGGSVTLALQRAATLNGTVSFPDGRLADDFQIGAVEHETGIARGGKFLHTNGRFSLSGVAPGEIEVTVTTTSGSFARAEVSIAAGQVVDDLQLWLVAPEVEPFAAGAERLISAHQTL